MSGERASGLSRRRFLSIGSAAVGLAMLGPAGCGGADEEPEPEPPLEPVPPARNLVIFMADDWRADLAGHLGHPLLRTPHLDRLAGEGVSATRLFSVALDCQPARVSLFSSLYASTHKVPDNTSPVPESILMIGEVLRDAGFTTGGFGKLNDGTSSGRDFVENIPFVGSQSDYYTRFVHWDNRQLLSGKTFLEPKECPTRLINEQGISFIRRHAGKRFYTLISIPEPHPPYIAPEPYYSRIPPSSIPVSTFQESESFWRTKHPAWAEHYRREWGSVSRGDLQRLLATYYAKIEFLDAELGRLRQVLEEEGILDQTIVLVISDHGDAAGMGGVMAKGGLMYDPIVRQLLVLRYPGLGVQGLRAGELLESVDVVPSLLEMLGVAPPASIEGRSSTSVLRGRRAVKSDVISLLPLGAGRMVRTARHKLIVYADSIRELYDLEQDPLELDNRIATADPALIQDLTLRLQRS